MDNVRLFGKVSNPRMKRECHLRLAVLQELLQLGYNSPNPPFKGW